MTKQMAQSPSNLFLDDLSGKIEDHFKQGTKSNLDYFSHVCWTPCGMYLDPCDPHPFNVRTKSFQMDFSHDKNKFSRWLTVKRSLMGADAGYGLFAARNFQEEDIITVYFGTKAKKR